MNCLKNPFQILCLGALLIQMPLVGQSLEEKANQKINELNELILTAEAAGLDANREKLAVRTAEAFLDYADWDEVNKSINLNLFLAGWHYRDNSSEMSDILPDFEREDVIKLLDEGLSELAKAISGDIIREPTVNPNWADITISGDQLTYQSRPVFLADWTWKPETHFLQEYHGQLDGYFITPGYVTNEQGNVNVARRSELEAKGSGKVGFIFINNRAVPQWAKTKYGENFVIKDAGSVRYTEYDIDHPGAKEMMSHLIEGFVPIMSNKNLSGLGYMLCNEPHFITSKKANGDPSWAGTGVSNFTIEKFKDSLESKHGTIAKLNAVWNTSFANFDEVSLGIPISVSMRGTPQWCDWMRFNMDRVTNWYQFMGDKVKESDPLAKVHLKLIPGQWTGNERDHGLDFEALTRMSDIIGNDAGAVHRSAPWNTEEWEEDYIFEWREMSMAHDFFKSIHPDKIMFNTESHFLSTKLSLNLYLDPAHARATYWLATTQGMNASQTWYWSRTEDGSPRNKSEDVGYGGSNNQQPRVTNEVHATVMDLNAHAEEIMKFQRQRKPIRIFYSETSAINKEKHMDDLFELYESLFFEGIPLGFMTKNILKEKSNWDVVLVYKTEFASQGEIDALQSYIDNGGTVIMDGVSLSKNEYGGSVSALSGTTKVSGLESMKSATLGLVESPRVLINESSDAQHAICTWKVVENDKGNQVLSVLNVGKVDATLKLQLKGASKGTTTKDLLNGIDIPNTQLLKPYDVLFAELRDEESPFSDVLKINKLTPEDIRLYPNPSSGSFRVDFGAVQEKTDVYVFDMNGRKNYAETLYGHKDALIDLAHLKAGIYFVHVVSRDEDKTLKFIKRP